MSQAILPAFSLTAAELCAKLWELFDAAKIPVIRCGLNPSEELSGGDAAAGAYHPAFGEMVLSRRYRQRMEPLLSGCEGTEVVLGVAPGQVSAAVGQRRENVRWAVERFGLKDLKVRECGAEKGEIRRISVAMQG